MQESFEFEGWLFHRVTVGNPHAVAFVADLSSAPVHQLGSELGRLTPGGINVEFVRVVDRAQDRDAGVGTGNRRDDGMWQRHGGRSRRRPPARIQSTQK